MEGEIARGGGVDGVNVQQCLTCLTGSWPSPCLSACLLPHRWDRIHLMSNYITSAPRCHRCALSSASVCVCVHISYTLSSPRARRITAFEFAFPCTTCSSVLYFTVFKIESAGGKHKTQTKARRLIRERWKPPPPLVLLCSADAPREGETARKERRADVFGSSQGQPVLMMAAWRLCCANKKALLCFLSPTEDEWHLAFSLSPPAFFSDCNLFWFMCKRVSSRSCLVRMRSWCAHSFEFDPLIKSAGVKLRSTAAAAAVCIQHNSVGVLVCTQTLLWMMCFPLWCLEHYITLYRKNKWENKH